MKPERLSLVISIACTLASAGCSSLPPDNTSSIEGAQHAFFPDRYEYTVGDFVLSLPIGYYELAMTRLKYAEHILKNGRPQPVTDQERYLALPADGVAPARHFLLLDQRHLLVYSEANSLEDGYPPRLEILKRTSDAGWTDVSDRAVPPSARSPKSVEFLPGPASVRVIDNNRTSQTLHWDGRALAPETGRPGDKH